MVRPLGIATLAVHLVGRTPDGLHWVQRRALTKPNDPGLWDTLMGGMVPAADSLEEALARETWEEAGLRLAQLEHRDYGGHILMSQPNSVARGPVGAPTHWYPLPCHQAGVPANHDGGRGAARTPGSGWSVGEGVLVCVELVMSPGGGG